MSELLSDYNKNGRVNSNVARTNIYSDLNLAGLINPTTKDIVPLTDIAAVRNSIKNLVLTNFYDRPFAPTIGSGVTSLLFEPASLFVAMDLKAAIERVIGKYEPRVNNVVIRILDDSDRNAYHVTIGFTVFYDKSTLNEVDFFLTRLR